jgi:hypothetical protein
MAKHADRVPVDDRYLRALGRGTYNFAYLEWGIVWLTETIEHNFLVEARKLTAGQISNRFSHAVNGLSSEVPDKGALFELASSFVQIVEDRNKLMHGNPFTAAEGEQRLLYNGRHGHKDWTIELIDAFSDETAIASFEANRLLHGGRLASYNHGKMPSTLTSKRDA